MSKPRVCRYKGFTLIEGISADQRPCWCVWEHYELRTGAPVRDYSSESVRYIGIERPTEVEAKATVRMTSGSRQSPRSVSLPAAASARNAQSQK